MFNIKLADAVKNVKDSGKRVIAYSREYNNSSYLISSQADMVMVNEYGGVSAFGFSRKREYYVDFYKNIKLNFNIFTAGDFKSGPEPYTRDSMSENDKLAWNEFANPMWKKMTGMMEEGRVLECHYLNSKYLYLLEKLKLIGKATRIWPYY